MLRSDQEGVPHPRYLKFRAPVVRWTVTPVGRLPIGVDFIGILRSF